MSKRIEQEQFEVKWLARETAKKYKESGLSLADFVFSLGFNGTMTIQIHYLITGKRGFSFTTAVRLATAAGIDLSELQRKIKK